MLRGTDCRRGCGTRVSWGHRESVSIKCPRVESEPLSLRLSRHCRDCVGFLARGSLRTYTVEAGTREGGSAELLTASGPPQESSLSSSDVAPSPWLPSWGCPTVHLSQRPPELLTGAWSRAVIVSVSCQLCVCEGGGAPESGIDLRPIGRAGAGRSCSEQGFHCRGRGERPLWAEMS